MGRHVHPWPANSECNCRIRPNPHDIKDLIEKGILIPQQGRVRDVFYGIRCSESILVVPLPEDL